MNPARKRFQREFGPIADALARVALDQSDRERVAEAVAGALEGRRDFRRDLFVLLASDPLVPCAGNEGPCPNGYEIRIAMHDRTAEDGRSVAWRATPPTVRCVSCGASMLVA